MVLKELSKALHDRNEIPHGISYPKILNEIHKFKESNSREYTNPVILIEFHPLPYMVRESPEEILRGRCWSRLVEEWKTFFDALVDEGMELVFFMDGYHFPNNPEKWLESKYENYLESCKSIESVKKGKISSKGCGNALTVVRDYLEQNLRSYGKWIKVFDSDVFTEMVHYAKEHKVFAVLSNNIEFLFYEGNYRIWNVRNIRFDGMSTKQINRFNFRKVLGLFPEHMPLFATLCGNDIISEKKLAAFHKSFPEKARIKGIAKYVTKVKAREEPVNLEIVSKRIGCTIEELEASLKKYELIREEKTSEEDSLTQKVLQSGKPYIYSFSKLEPFRVITYFEDIRSPILEVSQMELILYMHQCILGVCLKEKNDPHLNYPVYAIVDHDKGYERIDMTPEYPPFDIPPIEQLMFDPEIAELTNIRHELIKWCLKFDKLNSLNDIPDIFVPIVLTLNFMIKKAKFNIEDADILLISFYDTISDRVPILPDVKKETLDPYPFQYSFYYLRIQNLVIRFLLTIGLDKWTTFAEFNGFYFHHLYKLWKEMDEYAKNDRLSDIKKLRLYALESI